MPGPGLFVLAAIAVIAVTVAMHEAGHYWAARRCGMTVHELAVGIGPILWAHRMRSGSTFSVRPLPIGGFVRIAGITRNDADHGDARPENAFVFSPARHRLLVALAGVLVNFGVAWVALAVAAGLVTGKWLYAVSVGFYTMLTLVELALQALWYAVTGGGAAHGVSSALTLPQQLHDGVAAAAATDLGLAVFVLLVVALVNLSLGLGNLIPAFPLDGAQALVAVVDGVRKHHARWRGRAWPGPLPARSLRWFYGGTGAVLCLGVLLLVAQDVHQLIT